MDFQECEPKRNPVIHVFRPASLLVNAETFGGHTYSICLLATGQPRPTHDILDSPMRLRTRSQPRLCRCVYFISIRAKAHNLIRTHTICQCERYLPTAWVDV